MALDAATERIVDGARERGCALELNAQPKRLDLPDTYLQAAVEAGVKLAVSTDAHRAQQLGFMQLGVGHARRGWVTADDVLNTPSAEVPDALRGSAGFSLCT